jgi:hypothetical protein
LSCGVTVSRAGPGRHRGRFHVRTLARRLLPHRCLGVTASFVHATPLICDSQAQAMRKPRLVRRCPCTPEITAPANKQRLVG